MQKVFLKGYMHKDANLGKVLMDLGRKGAQGAKRWATEGPAGAAQRTLEYGTPLAAGAHTGISEYAESGDVNKAALKGMLTAGVASPTFHRHALKSTAAAKAQGKNPVDALLKFEALPVGAKLAVPPAIDILENVQKTTGHVEKSTGALAEQSPGIAADIKGATGEAARTAKASREIAERSGKDIQQALRDVSGAASGIQELSDPETVNQILAPLSGAATGLSEAATKLHEPIAGAARGIEEAAGSMRDMTKDMSVAVTPETLDGIKDQLQRTLTDLSQGVSAEVKQKARQSLPYVAAAAILFGGYKYHKSRQKERLEKLEILQRMYPKASLKELQSMVDRV
jgi:hypothetical protein